MNLYVLLLRDSLVVDSLWQRSIPLRSHIETSVHVWKWKVKLGVKQKRQWISSSNTGNGSLKVSKKWYNMAFRSLIVKLKF